MGFLPWLLHYLTGWPAPADAKEPYTPGEWLRQGHEFYDQRDYDKAMECFDGAIHLQPKSIAALFGRACCLLRQNRLVEAESAGGRRLHVIELNPYDEAAFLYRGDVYKRLGEHVKAIDDYSKVVELNAEDPAVYVARAVVFTSQKEYGKALADYSKVIELDPESARAFLGRGVVYAMAGEHDKALCEYTKSIELDPRTALSYINRGRAYRALGEVDKAAADFSKAVEIDPKNASAFTDLGSAFLARKEYAKAIQDFSNAIDLDPGYALAYSNLAWILSTCPDKNLRDGQQAVEYAAKACVLDGRMAYYLGSWAAALAEAGRFDEAVECQQKALDSAAGYSEQDKTKARQRLELYQGGKPYRDG